MRCLLSVFGLLSILCGCGTEKTIVDPVSPPSASPGPSSPPSGDVSVRVTDGAGYRRAIAERQGKVVLVDFWATWCIPCVERFPHIVELHQQHNREGLAVISVSLDDPADENQVRNFLKEKGAAFENLLSQFGGGTESADQFDIPGEVPFYLLFDRAGKLRYRFSGQPEGLNLENCEALDQVDKRVAELLAEPAA